MGFANESSSVPAPQQTGYPGQNYPGQNYPGQNQPGQNYPGQNYPGQNFPAPPPAYSNLSGDTITVPTANILIQKRPLGPQSTRYNCEICKAEVMTHVEHVSSTKTHLMALFCCLICPLGCCLIPYCMDSCMSTTHTCPICHAFLGEYQN